MGRGNVSKLNNKERRKEDRALKQARNKALVAKVESSLGAKGFNELQGMSWGEKINFVLSSAWILNAWYEKVGMLAFVFLGMWKILNLFGLF